MVDDNEFVDVFINGVYPLRLPRWRARFYEERGEHPGWEKDRLADMFEIVKPGWRIFDIGAECGDFTALYGEWAKPNGQIIPVEPQGHYWPIIKSIWQENHPDWPLALAFWGFASDAPELKEADGSWWGTTWGETCPDSLDHRADNFEWPYAAEHYEAKPEHGFKHLAQERATTAETTLDLLEHHFKWLQKEWQDAEDDCIATMPNYRPGFDMPTDSPPPYPDPVGTAVVMDIEGAEWHALQGAEETLKDVRPVWWISIHNSESLTEDGEVWQGPLWEWYGKRPGDIHELMASHDYTATYLGNDGGEEHWRYTPEEMSL